MSRLYKRYFLCAIVLILMICGVLYFLCGRGSDQFISVSYVLDEDNDVSPRKQIDWKENELLNLTNFRYTIQPMDTVCDSSSEELFAIIVITSYVGHDQVRSAHRAAISGDDLRKLNIVRVFLLATIPSKEKFITQEAIQNEHEHFNDIVQGNFMESYRNLSYKHAMGLRWSASHSCLKPKYIIKMDDDIVVDFYHLVHYLLTTNHGLSRSNNNDHFLAGYIFENVIPIRQRQNKWFVSTEEFTGSVYPSYLSGWMYVTTPYTARSLISAADRSTPIFWIDDTWITGILRDKQRIPINHMLNHLFSANSQFLDCCLADLNKFKYRCPFVAGPNGGDHNMIKQFLKATQKQCYDMSLDIMNDRCIERDPKLASLKESCVGSDKHLLREDHGAAIVNAIRL